MFKRLASILTLKTARQLVIGVLGTTIVLIGLVLLILPGPGIPILIAGLAILATEFLWAKRLLNDVKSRASNAAHRIRNGFRGSSPASTPTTPSDTPADTPPAAPPPPDPDHPNR
jgi:tellurite resistance protein TerC/cation:H+ antiporter